MLATMFILVLLPETNADAPTSVPPTPNHLHTTVTPLESEDGKNGLKDIDNQVNDICSKLWWSSWLGSSARWRAIVFIGGMAVPDENKEMFNKVTKGLEHDKLYEPLLEFLDHFNQDGQPGIKQTRDAGLALARNTSDPDAMREETITLDRNALIMLDNILHKPAGSDLLKFIIEFVTANSENNLDLTYEANLLKTLEPIRFPYVDRVCAALKSSELGDLVFTIRAALDVSKDLKKNPESTDLQTEEHYYVYQREVLAKKVVDTMLVPVSMSDRTKMADAIMTYYQTAPNVQLWEQEAKTLTLDLISHMRGQAGPK